MNIIEKIIKYFKDFFLSFYKSSNTIEETSEEITSSENNTQDISTNNDSNLYKINLRGYIKDYSIIDIKVKINDEDHVNLNDDLGYKEEYILESNCSYDSIYLSVICSIRCKDGEVLTNLGFTKLLYKGETTIYITDKLLGLKAISFGAVTEDFEPVKTTTIQL